MAIHDDSDAFGAQQTRPQPTRPQPARPEPAGAASVGAATAERGHASTPVRPDLTNDVEAKAPPGNRPRRDSRWDKTLQVRIPVEAWEAIVAEADRRGLPVSVMAGELLMAQLATLDTSTSGLISRIRTDLDALASRVE